MLGSKYMGVKFMSAFQALLPETKHSCVCVCVHTCRGMVSTGW